jgi:hypothetical protein
MEGKAEESGVGQLQSYYKKPAQADAEAGFVIDDGLSIGRIHNRFRTSPPQRRLDVTARSSWDESSQPAWLTPELFSWRIQPLLSNVATSVIRTSLGVSRWYASRIRQE